MTWDKLVALERSLPGYDKVEEEKMYVLLAVEGVFSYPCTSMLLFE